MYIFEEAQTFRQRWIWFGIVPLLLIFFGLFSYVVFRQVVLGRPVGDAPLPTALLLLMAIPVVIVSLGLPLLLSIVTLVVRVSGEAVEVLLVPFLRHRIPHTAIKDWRVRRIDRLTPEYAGLNLIGMRLSGSSRAYLVSGGEGVELDLVGGKRVFIGSPRAEELDLALDRAIFGDPQEEKLAPGRGRAARPARPAKT